MAALRVEVDPNWTQRAVLSDIANAAGGASPAQPPPSPSALPRMEASAASAVLSPIKGFAPLLSPGAAQLDAVSSHSSFAPLPAFAAAPPPAALLPLGAESPSLRLTPSVPQLPVLAAPQLPPPRIAPAVLEPFAGWTQLPPPPPPLPLHPSGLLGAVGAHASLGGSGLLGTLGWQARRRGEAARSAVVRKALNKDGGGDAPGGKGMPLRNAGVRQQLSFDDPGLIDDMETT